MSGAVSLLSGGDDPHGFPHALAGILDSLRGARTVGTGWLTQLVEENMLRWALIFLIIALVAAAFGFGGIAATAAGIAKILFYIFLVLFLIALIAGLATGRRIAP